MSVTMRVGGVHVCAGQTTKYSIAGRGGRRLNYLAGISASAIILAAGPALSQTVTIDSSSVPIKRVETGKKGSDAHTTGMWWWEETHPATAGAVGLTLDYRNNVIVNTTEKQRSIEIGSVGGQGGAGLKRDMEAAAGGAGGSVTFVQAASAKQTGDLDKDPTPLSLSSLLGVYSQGGRGGAGNLAIFEGHYELFASAGAGGAGGDVTVTHLSSIETFSRYLGGITVSSKGGAGGENGIVAEGGAQSPDAGQGGASGRAQLTIDKAASVTTHGTGAAAVVVESIAGNGSSADRGSDTAGGHAGNVTRVDKKPSIVLSSAGSVKTFGDYAPAFLLQSVGGEGGKGGITAVGGRGTEGGAGGAGGDIEATTSGSIETAGKYAYGLVAQSVGGTGGAGGSGVVYGGTGGNAGNAGRVTLTNSGTILTKGEGSAGMVAQSVGGGNAVQAFQSNLVKPPGGGGGAGGGSMFLVFSSGGTGGTGGNGDTVTVTNSNRIETQGKDALGIFAQSVGGGGGGGGDASAFGLLFTKALGGSAGGGGDGRAVTVNNIASASNAGSELGRGILTHGEGSSGIVAQSIGGGGGKGGSAEARSIGAQAAVAIALGASGGAGGSGDTVQITNGTSIETKRNNAHGIQAMSIGGGGGIAGASLAEAVSLGVIKQLPSVAVAVALGATGGKGGNGRDVTVNNAGQILTSGSDSFAISALSIGGGGGQGGFADAAASTLGGPSIASVNIAVGIGGSGGAGGSGGTVRVTNNATLKTTGDQATAILAGSIGGGGGAGGGADIAGYPLGTGKAAAVDVALGGSGGTGNTGGTVNLTNSRTIETGGFAANGMHAFSIGGGGGVGGAGVSKSSTRLPGNAGSIPASYGTSLAATVAVGGKGGTGGVGGAVDLTNSGTIETFGADARGILAQSIGGGGGLAASGHASTHTKIQGSFAIGGNGGSGNNGGLVTITNRSGAEIKTHGDGAFGVQAQSIGGGGGSGGTGSAGPEDDFTATLIKEAKAAGFRTTLLTLLPNFAKRWKISHSVPISVSYGQSVGGKGGAGGNGSTVTLNNAGNITTTGTGAAGLFAQSIGGGGGNGGASTTPGAKLVNVKVSLGGSGGAGGDGGSTTVTNSGEIQTGGVSGFGVLAQSVGGGGGLGVAGIDEGGSPFDPITLTAGGTGGAHGAGQRVIVDNTGSITTAKAEAHGVVAQSIGGGGGLILLNRRDVNAAADLKGVFNSGEKAFLKRYNIDVDAAIADAEAARRQTPTQAQAYKLELGGSDVKGNGGAVTVKSSGAIVTSGENAFGILAQSIGGGGGLVSGGYATTSTVSTTGRLGGVAGAQGSGDQVSVELGAASRIATTGTGATAIVAQSIGGGGGYSGALSTGTVSYTNFINSQSGALGRGGTVRVEMAGAASRTQITTTGANAHGIVTQSLGGGGGLLASTQGIVLPSLAPSGDVRAKGEQTGGAVTIDLRGSIDTAGVGSVGIFAQSGMQSPSGAVYDGSSTGQIAITFDGTINGGSGSGAAIKLDGGQANTLTFTKGAVITARSDQAIVSTHGQEIIENSGTVIGDVVLTQGTREINTFNNYADGIYRSAGRGIIDLGASGTFNNYGSFDVGGRNSIGVATFKGDFSQTNTGRLQVDVSSNRPAGQSRSDILRVDGAVTLGGTIEPYVVGGLQPETFRVATSTGSLAVLPDLKVEANPASPIRWEPNSAGKAVDITPEGVFKAPDGVELTPTENSALSYLQRIWDGGAISDGNAITFGNLANVTSVADYHEAIDSVSPDESASVAATQTLGAGVSMNMAMSCPVFAGTGTLLQETSCAWARVTGTWTRQSSSHDVTGFNQRAATYRLGAQHEFLKDWFLGGTIGYTHSNLSDSHGFSRTSGDALDVSLALKHQIGPWLLAASGHLGWGRYDTDRVLNIGPSLAASGGTSTVWTAAGRLRASYEITGGNWYLKPYADLDLMYTSMPGYSETGTGLTHLRFASAEQWNVAFTPAVEIGGRVDLSPTMWLRPYASVGVSFLAKDSMRVGVGFTDSLVPVQDFVTEVAMPGRLVNLTAGAQLFSGEGYDLRAEYKAGIGDKYLSQEVSARLSIPF
ncbi:MULTISPECIES: autotransporter outer membrane beta-barrel domain-containing protein [unclassified Chelatococcus]|uniref:autotransporter outer membrane beta-barrel domain-containing protein n=1 Tax=unclassified Chelatococcus TaxID=2638111 RepID=UPI001BCC9D8E|nr:MULTISPECIES: autotransporter outer membrane beta-barrel domain-containing protein [unclassified Chelatococcus]MBS7696485.1 autotransporter outer membrane beta-barrel domain-containing protein [Chelatococcus sp. YT9]MBX3555051.1 autotransporter outer membrane beta-barrel domain-containing protein [Chelatococcus sp.]